jgi:hypothetical protein
MLGVQFIKVQPTVYLLQYRKGQVVREGVGLSFFYYAPNTSLVAAQWDTGVRAAVALADKPLRRDTLKRGHRTRFRALGVHVAACSGLTQTPK